MTPDTLISFDGGEQPIAEHALDYGIPASRIIMRLAAGWSIENAITRPVSLGTMCLPRRERPTKRPAGNNPRLYTHNGETMSISAWSARTGVQVATIGYRLRRGLSFEEAISTKPLPRGPGSITRMREADA